MKSRLAVVIAAVVVPLAVLGFVVTRGGGSSAHKPAQLPIAAAGAGGTEQAARADMALYPYGGVVYVAGTDLPALDGTEWAYRVRGRQTGTDVRRLADAFGLHGDLDNDEGGGVFVRTGDAQVTVYAASGTWNYSSQSPDGVVSSGTAVACAPDNTECPAPPTTIPVRPADLPSHDDAKQIALDLLQRAGIDTRTVAVTVDDFTTQWSVRVDPIIDGITTMGFGSNITIGDQGVIEYANGVLGHVEPVDEYPLIGTAKAIELLNEGRGFIGPMPMEAIDTPALGAPTGDASGGNAGSGVVPPDTPTEPEPPITTDTTLAPPPPQQITLTGAERVLMFASSYDGTDGYLVPGYRFQTADGEGPTVLAIDDSFLAPPPGYDPGPKTGSADPGSIEPQPAPAPDQAPPETVEPPRDP